jgi:DNA gyrase subunit A
MAIRFDEADARPMGRATGGVRGLNLRDGDEVVGMVVVTHPEATILAVSENGLGKRTLIEEYRLQKRGGYGVINLRVTKKTGEVVTVRAVEDDEQLMMITKNGVVNRQRVSEISVIGRATQGLKLMNLDEGDVVVDVARVVIEDENGDDGEAVEGGPEGDGETAVDPDGDAESGAGDGEGGEPDGSDDES